MVEFSRETFADKEEYKNFLNFVDNKSKRIAALRKQNERKIKKIRSLKEMMSELHAKQESTAAEYLEVLQ